MHETDLLFACVARRQSGAADQPNACKLLQFVVMLANLVLSYSCVVDANMPVPTAEQIEARMVRAFPDVVERGRIHGLVVVDLEDWQLERLFAQQDDVAFRTKLLQRTGAQVGSCGLHCPCAQHQP